MVEPAFLFNSFGGLSSHPPRTTKKLLKATIVNQKEQLGLQPWESSLSYLYDGVQKRYLSLEQTLREKYGEFNNQALAFEVNYAWYQNGGRHQLVEMDGLCEYVMTNQSWQDNATIPTGSWLYNSQTGLWQEIPYLIQARSIWPSMIGKSSSLYTSPDYRYSLVPMEVWPPEESNGRQLNECQTEMLKVNYNRLYFLDRKTQTARNILSEDMSSVHNFALSSNGKVACFLWLGRLYFVHTDSGRVVRSEEGVSGNKEPVTFLDNARYALYATIADFPKYQYDLWDTSTGKKVTGKVTLPEEERYFVYTERRDNQGGNSKNYLVRLDLNTMQCIDLQSEIVDQYWLSADGLEGYTYNLWTDHINLIDVRTGRTQIIPLGDEAQLQALNEHLNRYFRSTSFTLFHDNRTGQYELHYS